jgi:hypothetical protein
MRVTGIPRSKFFNLKIEGKMAFWGNEGKHVIGCIYLMNISMETIHPNLLNRCR